MPGIPKNPIYELVDDETFSRLFDLGMLNEIAVRNVEIKQEFARLRQEASSTEAIAELARRVYRAPTPHRLSFSQVKKIIYVPSSLDELVSKGNGKPAIKRRRAKQ